MAEQYSTSQQASLATSIDDHSVTATDNVTDNGQPQGHTDSDRPLGDDGNNGIDLAVDSDETDSAIDVGSDVSSTGSFTSSVREAVIENGRSYHKYRDGRYFLPNDEREQERLDLQHQLWLLTLDKKLSLAPIEYPQNVLDLATGTGIWAIDYASQHPSASVLGIDLSPIQPNYVPPNCRFEVDDMEDTWTFNQTFNYIHARLVFGSLRRPEAVMHSAFAALEPGGYLEFQDGVMPFTSADGTMRGTAMERWNQLEMSGARALGVDVGCAAHHAQRMRDAGFVDVVEHHFAWPTNTWPKDRQLKVLGAWFNEDMIEGMHGMTMRIQMKGLGMTMEEVEMGLMGLREDLHNRAIHAYFPIVVVYGRKPE